MKKKNKLPEKKFKNLSKREKVVFIADVTLTICLAGIIVIILITMCIPKT